MGTQKDNKVRKLVVFDMRFQQMLVSAERYACGRMSYLVSDTVEYIERFVADLDNNILTVMIRDIESKIEVEQRVPTQSQFGMDMDRKLWMRLYRELLAEQRKRIEGG